MKVVEVFLQSTRSVVVVPNLVSLGELSDTPPTKTEGDGKSKNGAAPSILLRWELGTQVRKLKLTAHVKLYVQDV